MVAVRHGVRFFPEYVSVLGEMIRKHHGSELLTLTDQDDTPGYTVPLKTGLWGWWAKFELFAPWNEYLRPFLYFDLDTYILEDIRDIQPVDEFLMLRDFNSGKGASGIMIIPRKTDEIWDSVENLTFQGGDQDHLRKFPHGKLQDRYEGIVSYKQDWIQKKRKGRIVCFHGHPKPHEADGFRGDQWAGRIWAEHGGASTSR